MQTNPSFPITKYGILYIFLLQQISQKKEKKCGFLTKPWFQLINILKLLWIIASELPFIHKLM